MIFRKAALDRLSSPEQLDQLLSVTRPTGWLALLALGMVLLAALAWGIFGSLPDRVSGLGILLRRGGIYEVEAPAAGRILKIYVREGETVKQGQCVADIQQEELELQVRQARVALDLAEKVILKEEEYRKDATSLDLRDFKERHEAGIRSIGWYKEQIAILEKKIAVQKELLSEGLTSEQSVLNTQQDLRSAQRSLAEATQALERLDIERMQNEMNWAKDRKTYYEEFLSAQHRLDQYQLERDLKSHVISAFSGRVLEGLTREGSQVNPGDPIINLEPEERPLVAALFVPASEAKAVRPGMSTQLAPSAVKQEEYGFVCAKVDFVADYPASPKGIKRLLANSAMESAIADQGPSVLLYAHLVRDPKTFSGYRWTSSKGPSMRLTSGTVCTGSVITTTHRPITLVIPYVKKKLGL